MNAASYAAPEPPIHRWADTLRAAITGLEPPVVSRVAVVAETASTQDAARRMAGAAPGLLLIAGHQSAGRGRLGRPWRDTPGRSLAMTIALDAAAHPPPRIALAAGIAAATACEHAAPDAAIGLKWPNDVVHRPTAGKLAGVLVESAGPLLLVGIGVNANHTQQDLAAAGLPAAASLAAITGSLIDRAALAAAITQQLARSLADSEPALIRRWSDLETLTGTHQTFTHNGRTVAGVVESVDPTLTLVLRTPDGLVRLPALTTSVGTPRRPAGHAAPPPNIL